jgi:SLOG cluster4 family
MPRVVQKAKGLTASIISGNDTTDISESVDMAIITDLGYAGNNINVLTSPVTIAWGIGSDTASKIALVEK